MLSYYSKFSQQNKLMQINAVRPCSYSLSCSYLQYKKCVYSLFPAGISSHILPTKPVFLPPLKPQEDNKATSCSPPRVSLSTFFALTPPILFSSSTPVRPSIRPFEMRSFHPILSEHVCLINSPKWRGLCWWSVSDTLDWHIVLHYAWFLFGTRHRLVWIWVFSPWTG